jgi:hypothetical protein
MEALDQLISREEKKIDYLTRLRQNPGINVSNSGITRRELDAAEIDNDIEKAYEQLAIYRIRKLMGFHLS